MLAASEEAFESVNSTLSPKDRHAWSIMETTALEERWNSPEAMDIFDVNEKSGMSAQCSRRLCAESFQHQAWPIDLLPSQR